jgi:SRSO17 transposase
MAKRGKRVRLQKINRQSGNNQYYVTVPQTLLEQTSLGEDAEFTWELNESNGLSLRSEVCSDESEMSCGICLLDEFWRCWELIRPAFNTEEQWANAGLIAIGDILNTERHTLSQALAGTGLGEQDWNQFYRLFSKRRLDIEAFERALLQQLVQELPADAPVVLLIDDTQLRKSGKKIPGAKWLRDSLGPKFNVNLIWGQRFLQVSLAIPSSGGGCRSYPITFLHCPMPEKPGRQASAAQQEEYKVRLSDMALPRVAAEKVQELVAQLPGRRVEIVGDGGYTNSTFVRNLPEKNCVYLGRARKDAQLFAVPTTCNQGRGRPTYYGERLPTPAEQYEDKSIAFESITIMLNGKEHRYRVKERVVRSKIFGNRNLRLLVVAPVYYVRGRVKGHREPLYLLTTDMTSPLAVLLEHYIWRWEIELNFKDEKSIFGIHDPQVWNPDAVERRSPFIALVYSLFMLACHRTFQENNPIAYAKWRNPKKIRRASARDYRELFRAAVGLVMANDGANKSGFGDPSGVKANLLLFISQQRGRSGNMVS